MFQVYQYRSGHFCKLASASLKGAEITTWKFENYGPAIQAIHELWRDLDGQFSLVDESAGKLIAINFTDTNLVEPEFHTNVKGQSDSGNR